MFAIETEFKLPRTPLAFSDEDDMDSDGDVAYGAAARDRYIGASGEGNNGSITSGGVDGNEHVDCVGGVGAGDADGGKGGEGVGGALGEEVLGLPVGDGDTRDGVRD